MAKRVNAIKRIEFDPSDLVFLTSFFVEEFPGYSLLNYTDWLIEVAKKFYKKHYKTNWEESDVDWESAVYKFYNDSKPKELL